LRALARMLTTHRVHAVVCFPRHERDAGHVSSWKVITDLDLVQAACELDPDQATVADIRRGVVRCVQPDAPLLSAVQTMLAARTSHVIVVGRRHGRPLGILSTLDVARALAGYVSPAHEI
jgi:CBS-domain-containing membrane protein